MNAKDFMYSWESKFFSILDTNIEKIKNLKSKITKSGYYDSMVEWTNLTSNDIDEICITMQFLSMTASPNQKLICKYNLTENRYLINLMRHLYLDEDELTITMGYKRPFGNSNVEGDVREELKMLGLIEEEYYNHNNDYKIEKKILEEFSEFIIDFYNDGFDINWYSFEKEKFNHAVRFDWEALDKYWSELGLDRFHSYLRDWKIAKSEFREIKLNKILK